MWSFSIIIWKMLCHIEFPAVFHSWIFFSNTLESLLNSMISQSFKAFFSFSPLPTRKKKIPIFKTKFILFLFSNFNVLTKQPTTCKSKILSKHVLSTPIPRKNWENFQRTLLIYEKSKKKTVGNLLSSLSQFFSRTLTTKCIFVFSQINDFLNRKCFKKIQVKFEKLFIFF